MTHSIAVGHGNLDVARWLLDLGVDPNATSANAKANVFTRCRSGGYGAPVGMSRQQSLERRLEAYRMLLARGADINALDPFHAIFGCLSREMLPIRTLHNFNDLGFLLATWQSFGKALEAMSCVLVAVKHLLVTVEHLPCVHERRVVH